MTSRPLAAIVVALALTAAVPPAAQAAGSKSRVFVNVNFGSTVSLSHFTEAAVLHINAEAGSMVASYSVKPTPLIDVGGGARIWRQLSLGVSFSRVSETGGAAVSAEIPHPFVFNALRPVNGTAQGVTHEETGAHIDASWSMALTPRLNLTLFAGPSILSIRQDVVSAVDYRESYPFDTADFAGASLKRETGSKVGFDAGVDLAMFFNRTVGVGVLLRETKATVDLDAPPGGGPVRIDAGGFQAAGGLRLRF